MDVDKLLNARKVKITVLNHRNVGNDTLQNILDKNNLSNCALANVLGVKESTLEHWLEGRAIPNCAKMLIALIDAHPEVMGLIRKMDVIDENDYVAQATEYTLEGIRQWNKKR